MIQDKGLEISPKLCLSVGIPGHRLHDCDRTDLQIVVVMKAPFIKFACGKFPLWAHRDGGMRRSGCLVFSQGALLKVFQKVLSEIWESSEPKRAKRKKFKMEQKEEPTRPK